MLLTLMIKIMPQDNNSYSPNTSLEVALNRDLQKHEQNKLKERHSYDLSKQERDNAHAQEQEKIKLGRIGRWFGTGENASKNITAIICILLIVGGTVVSLYAYACKDDKEVVGKIWGTIAPIITLSLGYLFGKK